MSVVWDAVDRCSQTLWIKAWGANPIHQILLRCLSRVLGVNEERHLCGRLACGWAEWLAG